MYVPAEVAVTVVIVLAGVSVSDDALHVPPGVPSLNVILFAVMLDDWQTAVGPDIAAGFGLTVIPAVEVQPVPSL